MTLCHDLLSPVNDVSLRRKMRVDRILIRGQPLSLRSSAALGFDGFRPERRSSKPWILLRLASNLRQLIPLRAVRGHTPVLLVAMLVAKH